MTAGRVEDLRAWQLAYGFKLAVYRILRSDAFASDHKLRDQVRESAASAVSQIEEGFARFYPKDFGRMVVGARASIKECCGHLRDAIDRAYISEETEQHAAALARDALREIGGLLDYLQSPEAERNARRIKERRAARRQARKDIERGTEIEKRDESRTRNRKTGIGNGRN